MALPLVGGLVTLGLNTLVHIADWSKWSSSTCGLLGWSSSWNRSRLNRLEDNLGRSRKDSLWLNKLRLENLRLLGKRLDDLDKTRLLSKTLVLLKHRLARDQNCGR